MKKFLLAASALALAAGAARADFVLKNGNAAFTAGTFTPTFFSYSNSTAPNDFSGSSQAINARGNLWIDVPNYAGSSSTYPPSPLRTFNWGFRSSGTAGTGLASGAGGVTYSQTFTDPSATATARYTDAFQNSSSRINATLVYTLQDSFPAGLPSVPGAALVKCVATFQNNVAASTRYDFMLLVDSQILGSGAGANDVPTVSIDSAANRNSIKFTDSSVTGVGGNPYFINFISDTPDYWEVGQQTSGAIGAKIVATGATANVFAAAGSTTTGVVTATSAQDPFGVFMYRRTLAAKGSAGDSFTVTSYIYVNSDASSIPEPAALGLLAPVAMLAGRRRRA